LRENQKKAFTSQLLVLSYNYFIIPLLIAFFNTLYFGAICAVHFFGATAKVIKPSGSDEKDGGDWWSDLPDWLMQF
jgi:hypothetical protein